MKKLSLILAMTMAFGLLVGCGAKEEAKDTAPKTETTAPAATTEQQAAYKDGSYRAEGKEFDAKSGWKGTVEVTVKDGKIATVNWDAVHKDGGDTKKVQSQDGRYDMVKGGGSSHWHEQAASMEKALIEKQDPAAIVLKEDGKTDAVTGVSIHVSEFVQLAQEALASAK
ncbi:FMN-binding protein [Paenibacillus agilis]|uniref:FMN-binding protein n=1 Tax=Paenibacillus agilis TaxID=3020863 RepID=A0A559IPU9_9BACL|nr:FMN-binding protein [Paenibacillus agilis]TVX89573.1 FMN-binding protein [Paenibacillus agilis]